MQLSGQYLVYLCFSVFVVFHNDLFIMCVIICLLFSAVCIHLDMVHLDRKFKIIYRKIDLDLNQLEFNVQSMSATRVQKVTQKTVTKKFKIQ